MNYTPPRGRLAPFHPLAARFRDGGDTPRALLERCLDLIASKEPELRAFAHLNADGARTPADAATRRFRDGRPRSPVDGMPLGVKDIIDTADMPTGMGSPIFAGHRPRNDAAAVWALRDAGAVVVGKTVTTEFAAVHPAQTRNPFDPARSPGGSSSGSAAAVGGGLIPVALGSQVVSSTIRPASLCGCYALKPTLGALNRGGSLDFGSSSCLTVLGASLPDLWITAAAIVARVGGDPGHIGLRGEPEPPPAVKPRRLVRLDTAGWPDAARSARAAFEGWLAGVAAREVEIVARRDTPEVEALEAAMAESEILSRRLVSWETGWLLKDFHARVPDLLSPAMRKRAETVHGMDVAGYHADLARRDELRRIFAAAVPAGDAFVTMAAASAAPVGLASAGNPAFNTPASLLGVPALALPLLSDEGLPLGVQLIGPMHGDRALMAMAAWLMGAAA